MVRNNPVSLKDVDGKQSNFKDLFKPEQGDLIFGLTKVTYKKLSWFAILMHRGDVLAMYVKAEDIVRLEEKLNPLRRDYVKIRNSTSPKGLPFQKFGESRFWGQEYASIDRRVSSVAEEYYANIKSHHYAWSSNQAYRKFSKDYAAELAVGKYSVRKTFQKYVNFDEEFAQELLGRASKAGLSTILKSDSSAVVHFMLDDLDMDQVVMKTQPSATSSELRYLYRNREKLLGKVLFYKGGQLVDAPWRTDRAGWARYKPGNWSRCNLT
jgi:insecticidal toxin complex protein TccC